MPDTAADAVLCAIAAQLDEIMAAQTLRQADVFLRSGGRVSAMSVSRILRARNHQITTLVELFDSLGYTVSVTICPRNQISDTSIQAASSR